MTKPPPFLRAEVMRLRALYESGVWAYRNGERVPLPDMGYSAHEICAFNVGWFQASRSYAPTLHTDPLARVK